MMGQIFWNTVEKNSLLDIVLKTIKGLTVVEMKLNCITVFRKSKGDSVINAQINKSLIDS